MLFLYTLGSKVVELGQGTINEYHAVKVCYLYFTLWFLFFGTCIASLFDNTALVSASAPINTVVYPENFEWFLFVHCLNVCCKAITRISFHKTSMFCDCSDLFAFFYNINKFLIFEEKKFFFSLIHFFYLFILTDFLKTFPTSSY